MNSTACKLSFHDWDPLFPPLHFPAEERHAATLIWEIGRASIYDANSAGRDFNC
jgi:hypothetical protein